MGPEIYLQLTAVLVALLAVSDGNDNSLHDQEKGTEPARDIPASVLESGDTIERGQWVRRITGYVQVGRYGSRHNVLTVNTELEYYLNAENCVEATYHTWTDGLGTRKKYRTVVFGKGSLVNFGDGAITTGNITSYGKVGMALGSRPAQCERVDQDCDPFMQRRERPFKKLSDENLGIFLSNMPTSPCPRQ
ncbi:hypothetical protein GMORB2_0646 [Geosmithia morbida]|uniref:Uncharacterized protein n=1 Tax=Geosmithia morbida TaxID=1094350 RepID=A0A9P4Z3S9_9HYPO|nr:uncharacterized protein GMORB2_0646 [Geosmithia morbida]KAF4126909.1 hypothetical protein GMORB2_0646 [Geosmithia morbida]